MTGTSENYAPEDANLTVTLTVADYYEAIRQAQEEAWEQGYDAGDVPCETAVPCGDCPACNSPAAVNPYTPETNR